VTARNGEAGAAATTAPAGQGSDVLIPTTNPSRPDLTSLIRTAAELWPVFTAKRHGAHKALAIGIDKQLIATGVFKPWEVGVLLHAYCRRRCYRAAVAAGSSRFNLDGTVAGEISPEDIASAKAALADMDTKAAELAAVAKAARKAERAKRRAEREAVEKPKGPRPYHRAAPQKVAVQPLQPGTQPSGLPKLGLADLKRAFQERQRQAAKECAR
jgi:ProP effector